MSCLAMFSCDVSSYRCGMMGATGRRSEEEETVVNRDRHCLNGSEDQD